MARQQIVLRVDPATKKHVKAQAKAAGKSINEYCEGRLKGRTPSAGGSKGSK